MSTANRKYKDSVFVDLFSEDEKAKENFLSLYNALHNTNLQLSCPVENIRLDNTLYMNIINDVSCLVDTQIIVLAEHPRPKMNILVHFWATSSQANSLLRGTTAILAVLKCTSLHILELQVCRANLFLRGTSGILAAS